VKTLAFDVYGTLIDTYGMIDLLQRYIGDDQAMPFAVLWRDKQLEYAFRRSMMDCYQPFNVCTADALSYCVDALGVSLTGEQRDRLLERYLGLPVFDDVPECLALLGERSDVRVYAFSNGPRADVERLFASAGIEEYFGDIVSVDEIRRYKPDPAVYRHLLDRTGSAADGCWLISSNAFDVIGASSSGMNSVWLRRTEQQHLDPWGGRPALTIRTLTELHTSL
jgi:2-haloacid dehalogenase